MGLPQRPQICALSAATANALTTVLAGLAFTTTSLPNIIFLVAFVAGFLRVLILASPGIVKMPVFFTSAWPSSANEFKTLVVTLFFSSTLFAIESAMEPLVMALFPAAFFIAAPLAMVVFPTKFG